MPYYAEKSDSKKAKYGGKVSKKHNLPTSGAMQDVLQQVFREKDAAFREKETENAFQKRPLKPKCGGMRHIMVLATNFVNSIPYIHNQIAIWFTGDILC